MEYVKNIIGIYVPFTKSIIQKRLSYKLTFIMRVISGVIQVFVSYYLWKAIYESSTSNELNGFSMYEMIIYVVISYITNQLIQINMDPVIGEEIRNGSIAMNLLKPINYTFRILAEAIGHFSVQLITVAIPTWIGFNILMYIVYGNITFNIKGLILYIISVLLGFLVMFTLNCIFGLSAFFLSYLWGFTMCKKAILKFFSGELIPLAFYPPAICRILKIMPFATVNDIPVLLYLGKKSIKGIVFSFLIQIIWLVILVVIYKLLWKKAIKHLTIMGG